MKRKNIKLKRRWRREHPRVQGHPVPHEVITELRNEDPGDELVIRLIEHSVDMPTLPELEAYYAAQPTEPPQIIVDDVVDMGNDIQEEEEEAFPRTPRLHTKKRRGSKYQEDIPGWSIAKPSNFRKAK